MYHITIAICLIASVLSIACAAIVTSPIGVAIIAMTQCAVYGTIALFAQRCRSHAVALGIVTLNAVVAFAIGANMLRLISRPAQYGDGIFFYWNLIAQPIIAVFGCYVGYAIVEHVRLRDRSPNSMRGKLLVSSILAAAVLAVACLFAID